MRNCPEEFGAVVFLLNRIGLSYNSQSPFSLPCEPRSSAATNGKEWLTSESVGPRIVTSSALSSNSCSLFGGARCHTPLILTDVPVPKL